MTPARSESNIKKITELFSSHQVIDNFLTEKEIEFFLTFRKTLPKQSFLDHNRKTFDLSLTNHNQIPDFFHLRLGQFIKNYKMRLAYFMDRESPFQLHCDSGNNPEEIPYKNLILSLDCDGNQGKLVLFKQYGLRSLFFVDKDNPNIYFQDIKKAEHGPVFDRTCENYQFIRNLNFSSKSVSGDNIFHHIKPAHLDGFEIDAIIEHKFNRLIIFDACQFHCSADSYPENYGVSRRFTTFTSYEGA